MKICKIKKLKNKEKILSDINSKIEIDDWEKAQENSYVIIENEEIIPAYITIKNDCITTLWVEQNYRRKGYGEFLVKTSGIKYATVLHSSVPFWQSLGFCKNSKNSIIYKKI